MKTQIASVMGRLFLSYSRLCGPEPAGDGCSPARGQGDSQTRAPIPSCAACSRTSLGSPHALQGDSSQVESIPRTQALRLRSGAYTTMISPSNTTTASQAGLRQPEPPKGAGSCLSPRHRGDNRGTDRVSDCPESHSPRGADLRCRRTRLAPESMLTA